MEAPAASDRGALHAPSSGRIESTLYLLLAWFFSYPAEPLYGLLVEEGLADEIRALVAQLPFEVDFRGLPRPSLLRDELESTYINSFDIGAPYVPCPLYEGDYGAAGPTRTDILEEILRFHEHFDIEPNEKERDYPDHLVAELEFMAFLAGKEAHAVEEGRPPDGYRAAERDFLERHLARWVARLDERIQMKLEEPFYKAASAFMVAFIGGHLSYLKSSGAKGGEP